MAPMMLWKCLSNQHCPNPMLRADFQQSVTAIYVLCHVPTFSSCSAQIASESAIPNYFANYVGITLTSMGRTPSFYTRMSYRRGQCNSAMGYHFFHL
nr:hypothetical protein Iba_chr08dCG4950 [Ipomoea batatas]